MFLQLANFFIAFFKIEWNRKFLEIRFENFSPPFKVVLFSGNLEIPEISCSIWHFYRIGPSTFSREKLQDIGKSFESTLHAKWSATVQARSWSPIPHENVRIWFPRKLWTGRSKFPMGQFARFAYSPARKVLKFLSSHTSGPVNLFITI